MPWQVGTDGSAGSWSDPNLWPTAKPVALRASQVYHDDRVKRLYVLLGYRVIPPPKFAYITLTGKEKLRIKVSDHLCSYQTGWAYRWFMRWCILTPRWLLGLYRSAAAWTTFALPMPAAKSSLILVEPLGLPYLPVTLRSLLSLTPSNDLFVQTY